MSRSHDPEDRERAADTASGTGEASDRRGTGRRLTLGTVFDPRENALNLIRLLLALFVIVWHAFPLTGAQILADPVHQLVSRLSVDGFFAISGFLIVSSWLRHPRWGAFLRARALRIFPAFWVCLVVTAGVFAPLAVLMRSATFPDGFASEAVSYVWRNMLLRISQFGIAGTPAGVPEAGVWNGALWTLFWEFSCYLAVLAVGLVGLLRRRLTVPALFVATLSAVLLTSYGPVTNGTAVVGARLGLMFAAGAVMHRYRDTIPVGRSPLLAAGAIVLLATWLPEYSPLAALPLAYLVIALGALGKHRRLRIGQDLSYGVYIYGFPVQQLLATAGAGAWGVPAFAVVSVISTLPLAAASWFLVEKPALRLKAPTRRIQTVQDSAVRGLGS
ncbi:acyltransferase [Clavibacter lycopersici]|uniref:Acyltransferase n=1 Tax=Clavibacter lycopersici TaxID=2301718 RepID=A0A399T8A2_9MICO|nr:acyltransferase [Clavibacter lycopersici]RIJ52516.1 acyltransferase [Clavibacter lycopersici]RIJ62357.1 acyltransferase [Clavibacter lycopersici]